MGDMLQQQDGRLLLSYVREVYTPISDDHGPELVARYSSDQGKTWGEEFTLVPKPRPLSKYFYCHHRRRWRVRARANPSRVQFLPTCRRGVVDTIAHGGFVHRMRSRP